MHLTSEVTQDLLLRIEPGLLAVGTLALLATAIEVGFRLGRRARVSAAAHAELSTLQSSMVGLLALLLGFSFSMADGRYETRKQLIVDEANAIGTTLLRAQLLPEPQRSRMEALLARYVDARLAFHDAGVDRRRLARASVEAEALHAEMWSTAVAAADPRAITTGLFLQSLNEVIDLHTKRRVALENRVPTLIMSVVLLLAVIACAFIGAGCGVAGRRHLVATSMTAITFVTVIMMIADLDRPDRGFVQVSQQSMVRLRRALR